MTLTLVSHGYAVAAHVVQAAGSGSSSSSKGSNPLALVLPVLIVVLLYFTFIRPGRMRARRAQQAAGEVSPGLQVMTTTGLYGTVAGVEDDTVLLEIAPGVTTKWAKAAIARVLPPPEALGLETIPDEDTARPAEPGAGAAPGSGTGLPATEDADTRPETDPPH